MRLIAMTALFLMVPMAAGAADYSSGPVMNDPDTALRGAYIPDAVSALPSTLGPVAGSSFGGLYFGASVGLGGDHDVYQVSALDPQSNLGSASLKSSGFIGGGQVGYNYAAKEGAVLGIETDFSGSTIGSGTSIDLNGSTIASGGSRVTYLGTVRGRVGYTFGSVMVFATGGFAYASATSKLSVSDYGSASVSTMHEGFAAGGGIEYAVAPNVFVRTEFLRVDLNAQTLATASIAGSGYQLSERPYMNIVRAGLDFRFSGLVPAGPSTVTARY